MALLSCLRPPPCGSFWILRNAKPLMKNPSERHLRIGAPLFRRFFGPIPGNFEGFLGFVFKRQFSDGVLRVWTSLFRTTHEGCERALSVPFLFEQLAEGEVGVAPAAVHSESEPSNRVVHLPRSKGDNTHIVLCSRKPRIGGAPEPELHFARSGLVVGIPEAHFVCGFRITGLSACQNVWRRRRIVAARTDALSEQPFQRLEQCDLPSLCVRCRKLQREPPAENCRSIHLQRREASDGEMKTGSPFCEEPVSQSRL